MSKMISLVTFIGYMSLLLYCYNWYKLGVSEYASLEEYALEKQVNYASDAAVAALILSDDTDQDIEDSTDVSVQPDLARDEFCRILATDFGYHVTDETIDEVAQRYVKALLVCDVNGVYAYCLRDISESESAFAPTPLMPYFYESDNGTQYALSLGMERGYKTDKEGGSGIVMSIENMLKYVSADQQRTAINNHVSDMLQWALMQSYREGALVSYSIPSYASQVSGAQPVEGITVIGVVDTSSLRFVENVTAMGVGGSRLRNIDLVLCFTKDGTKYYVYESQAAAAEITPDDVETTKTSAFDAAAAGYYFYFTDGGQIQ